MAITFYKNIRPLMLNCLLTNSTTYSPYTTGGYSATIYSGAQPSASAITSNWTSYNSTFLVHIPSVVLFSPNLNSADAIIQLSSSGSSTAIMSGTAAWGLLWPSNPTQANVQASSIPSTQFLVVPVTSLTGTGVLRLNSTTIVAGLSYSIIDATINAGGGTN